MDFIIRPSRLTDYDAVINLVQGLYFGTDTLPSEYVNYLRDPNRLYYVAEYRGKVVAFAGGRITDNGETFEPGVARTHPDFRNRGLYQRVRERVIEEGMKPKWPHLQRIRMVTSAVDEIRKRQHRFRIMPGSMREATVVLNMVPTGTFISTMDKISGHRTANTPMRMTKTDLEHLFTNQTERKRLFPDGLIMRNSESYMIGQRYMSNISLLFADHLGSIYVTKSSVNDPTSVKAISFGIGKEANPSRDVLIYVIDYYGLTDYNVLFGHFMNHLQDVKSHLVKTSSIAMVTIQLFLPIDIYKSDAMEKLRELVRGNEELRHYCVGEKLNYTQIVCDVIQHPHSFNGTPKHNL